MSEYTARLIDEEIRRIVTAGEQTAWEILRAHRKELEAVTQASERYPGAKGACSHGQ